jgi:hypothetical protein
MLVIFTNPDGTQWKGFGTVPSTILGEEQLGEGGLRGHRIAFKATFQPKEEGFAYFSRPTQAALVREAAK